jgi:hypothetical protein
MLLLMFYVTLWLKCVKFLSYVSYRILIFQLHVTMSFKNTWKFISNYICVLHMWNKRILLWEHIIT